jgi:hypothetical protein
MTKVTAAPIPNAVSIFLDTPRNGQIPKNCDNTILLTNIAEININKYSIIVLFNV